MVSYNIIIAKLISEKQRFILEEKYANF